jgi:NADH-quinone oxidoreductase subunit J
VDVNWHTIFFLLFSAFACFFALAVAFSSNIVRMAFYLIVSLGATAGLFFLAGADFVGSMQLLIYVGGTLVLLIFGVMLTAQGPFITMKTRGGDWILAAGVGGSLLAILVQAAFSVESWRNPDARPAAATDAAASHVSTEVNTDAVAATDGVAVTDGVAATGVAVPSGTLTESTVPVSTETATSESAAAASEAVAEPRSDEQPESEDERTATPIGLTLLGVRVDSLEVEDPVQRAGMSGYLLPFEIVSVHLLVVLIGAAYLARAKRRRTVSSV